MMGVSVSLDHRSRWQSKLFDGQCVGLREQRVAQERCTRFNLRFVGRRQRDQVTRRVHHAAKVARSPEEHVRFQRIAQLCDQVLVGLHLHRVHPRTDSLDIPLQRTVLPVAVKPALIISRTSVEGCPTESQSLAAHGGHGSRRGGRMSPWLARQLFVPEHRRTCTKRAEASQRQYS